MINPQGIGSFREGPEFCWFPGDEIFVQEMAGPLDELRLYMSERYQSEVSSIEELEAQSDPCHFALKFQDLRLLRLLVAAGADINRKDCNGKSPLHLVCQRPWQSKSLGGDPWAERRRTVTEVLLLVELGADVDLEDTDKKKPYQYLLERQIIRGNYESFLCELLGKSKTLSQSDVFSYFQLRYYRYSEELLNLLIRRVPEVLHANDSRGHTLLYYAVRSHCWETVRFLLQKGVALNDETLSLARRQKRESERGKKALKDKGQKDLWKDFKKTYYSSLWIYHRIKLFSIEDKL